MLRVYLTDLSPEVVLPLISEFPQIISHMISDIHMVVDGWAPKYTAPEKAVSKEGFKEICIKCPYHRYD